MTHQAEEMVRAPEGVESQSFDPVRDPKPSVPGQPLLPLDHDPDPHGSDLSPTGIVAGPARLEQVMPAITVDNILILPRVTDVDPAVAIERPVLAITTAPKGVEGEGFPVRRAFYGLDQRYLDPFIHMDQMGEVEYGPGEPKGTAWHPHRGFETVTYMIDGTFQHQDSTGGGGLITNGATQWMTAGAGILHIERPPEALIASGGLFHGIQLWVNLPAEQKWTPPRYQDIGAARVTLLSSPDGGALVAWYGPFVMNTHEELAQAFDDYRRGRMGTIPAAHIGN